MIFVKIVISALIVIAAAYLQVNMHFFKAAFSRQKASAQENERELEMLENIIPDQRTTFEKGKSWLEHTSHESVVIKSTDTLTLCGKLYEQAGATKTIILFHSFRSTAQTDFAPIAPFFYEMGLNVLLVDQRAHGSSEGRYICHGVKERYDCLEWIEFIRARFGKDCEIYLGGIAMGATTVLMAAGLNLPKNVKGVIADTAFSSCRDVIYAQHDSRIWHRFVHYCIFPTLSVFCEWFGHFHPGKVTTVDAMKQNKTPILFIHAQNDGLIPENMTCAAYDACDAPKSIYLVPNAGHGLSYLSNEEECQRLVKKFLGA